MPRFRPRISILNALLLTTVVAMAIVIVQFWREVGPLRSEVRQLRDELGVITVSEPSKLHAIQVRTKDEMIWKWRVWVPEGKKVRLKLLWSDVPLNGYPSRVDVTTDELHPGQQWVTVRVQKAAGIDKWQCALERQAGEIFLPIAKDKEWFLTPHYDFMAEGVMTESKMDRDDDGRDTFLLMRHRVQLRAKKMFQQWMTRIRFPDSCSGWSPNRNWQFRGLYDLPGVAVRWCIAVSIRPNH